MKYYLTICITGTVDEMDSYDTLEEAKAERERRDKDAVESGHLPGFWIVVDENGKQIDPAD